VDLCRLFLLGVCYIFVEQQLLVLVFPEEFGKLPGFGLFLFLGGGLC